MDHRDWVELNGILNGIIQKLNELEERLNKIDGKKTVKETEPIKEADVGSF
jgi:hypothetical protein